MAWSTEDVYGYEPVEGLAYAAAVVFLMLAILMFFVNLKFPPNRFMHVLVFAALGEVAGFAVRIVTVHYCTMVTYIITTLFLLLMPNCIALVNYMAAGRLMAISNQNVGCLRPSWLAKTFFISDILSFGVQGMGGGLLASDNQSSKDLGKNIITAGLVLQSLALFLFLWVTITIHKKPRYQLTGRPDAERMFTGLYITTGLLFVRSIYRLVEYAAGEDSYLRTHEWPFYVFDSLAMAAAFIVYSVPALHFGRCLNELKQQATLPITDLNAASDTKNVLAAHGPHAAMYHAPNQVVPIKG